MHLRAIQKRAEGTGDLSGNKIANKITKAWKYSPEDTSETFESETETPEERYIYPEERQKIIGELKLI